MWWMCVSAVGARKLWGSVSRWPFDTLASKFELEDFDYASNHEKTIDPYTRIINVYLKIPLLLLKIQQFIPAAGPFIEDPP